MTPRVAPTLETARLRLRAHRVEDFEPIFAAASDPEVMRHITGPMSREDTWRRMMCGPGSWALLGYGYWVVERLDDGAVIGQVGLADFKRDMVPSIEGLPELGYVFAAAGQGRGFATEAALAALAFADRELAAEQVVAIIDPDNGPSIRVAERCGFTERETSSYRDEPILLFRRRKPERSTV
jgi:RimJ/RimL family protein N-acetyltransferase